MELKKRFREIYKLTGLHFDNKETEREYIATQMHDQRSFLGLILIFLTIMGSVLIYNAFANNYSTIDLYQRVSLILFIFLNGILFKFAPQYTDYSFLALFCYFCQYFYRSYQEIYTEKPLILSTGSTLGIVEIIVLMVMRDFTTRFLAEVAVITLRIFYVRTINSFIQSFICIVFCLMFEGFKRKNFKNLVSSRDKAMRFQKLISYDFPLIFLIIGIDDNKILFQNAQATSLCQTSNDDPKSLIDHLVWHKEGQDTEDFSSERVTLGEYLSYYLKVTNKNTKSSSKFSPLFKEPTHGKQYEIKIIETFWESKESLGIILNDVTEKRRAESIKKLNEYKDLVIASVSHELRTPLNGILGMLKMAIDETKDFFIMKYLENCNSCAKLLLHFVNSILDSSQIDAQKIQLNMESVRFNELKQELFSIYNFQANYKKITFNITFDESLPLTLYTDKYRLLQVLINLISNAIKFTPKGSVTLHIGLQQPTGDSILFSVIDTGIGIKPEDLNSLFQKFGKLQQADRNINARGVGLGLSISNEIVKILNDGYGDGIDVQSQINKGTTFSFTLPCLRRSHLYSYDYEAMEDIPSEIRNLKIYNFSQISPRFRDETKETQSNELLFKKKCLVVDDNSYNLIAISHILKKINIDIMTSLSGEDAIALATSHEFDIIFMDIQMPVLDGVETTKILLEKMKEGKMEKVPIIALTANGEGNKETYINLGMADMIVKPATEEKIKKILKRFSLL